VTQICLYPISIYASLFYSSKIFKISGRITKLHMVEKWHIFIRHKKCNKFEHFSFSR